MFSFIFLFSLYYFNYFIFVFFILQVGAGHKFRNNSKIFALRLLSYPSPPPARTCLSFLSLPYQALPLCPRGTDSQCLRQSPAFPHPPVHAVHCPPCRTPEPLLSSIPAARLSFSHGSHPRRPSLQAQGPNSYPCQRWRWHIQGCSRPFSSSGYRGTSCIDS